MERRDPLDHVVHQETTVCQGHQDHPDHLDHQDFQEVTDRELQEACISHQQEEWRRDQPSRDTDTTKLNLRTRKMTRILMEFSTIWSF